MASDITLSSGVRSNLLQLQSTADLIGRTQTRLATGKKVNSALDNPSNFFTSQALSSRAGDLSRLLDSVGNAIKTIEQADNGIKSLTKLVESAQATARQALQAARPTATYELEVTGTEALADDVAATTEGTVDLAPAVDLSALDGESMTVTVNGVDTIINISNGDDSDVVVAALDAIDGIGASLNGDGELVITADDTDTSFSIAYSDASVGTALGVGAGTFNATNSDIGAITGTLTVAVNGGATQTLTFGAGNIENRAQLEEALGNLTGITATINGDDEVEFTSNANTTITLGGTGSALTDLGLSAGSTSADQTITQNNATRASLEADFNTVISQIDQLVADTSYNGVNLLNGDNLTVLFNEDGSSSLQITGVTFDAAGLGLAAAATDSFQSDADLNTTLDSLGQAINTLRTQASRFGSNLSIVQTRQEFTKAAVNTLQVGADQLVLADTNEEGANLLALQTRQQLSTTALSLASQADQNVLRLF